MLLSDFSVGFLKAIMPGFYGVTLAAENLDPIDQ
jgi:hypothetical protein